MADLLLTFGDGGRCALFEALSFALGCIIIFGFALAFAAADNACNCVGGMLGGGGIRRGAGPSDAGTSSCNGGGAFV